MHFNHWQSPGLTGNLKLVLAIKYKLFAQLHIALHRKKIPARKMIEAEGRLEKETKREP